MFTWPRPGIQIGSCMRSTPGATSVTSSDACFLLLPRCGPASDARPDERRSPSRRGVLRCRPSARTWATGGRLGDEAAREHELLVVPARDDLQADRQPSGERPAGMLTAGWPEMLNGAVNGTEPMPPTRCPPISSGGGPSAANAVVAVVGVNKRSTSSNTARSPRAISSRRRSASKSWSGVSRSIDLEAGPGHRRDVGQATARRLAVMARDLERRDDAPRARRLRDRDVEVDEVEPGVGDERDAASCASFSTSGSHTAKPSVEDHATRLPRRRRPRRPRARSLRRDGPARGSDVGSTMVGPAIAST